MVVACWYWHWPRLQWQHVSHLSCPTGSLSFRTARCTNYTPTRTVANSWQELELCERDSYSHYYVVPKSRDPASHMPLFVPTGDNVGMWCSLAHPVSLLHPSLMPSLSLSIKVWDTIIPILCLSLSPSISPVHCEWESGTQLPLFSISLSCTFSVPPSL